MRKSHAGILETKNGWLYISKLCGRHAGCPNFYIATMQGQRDCKLATFALSSHAA